MYLLYNKKGLLKMTTANDINGFLSNFEELIAAIIAENCSEMYKWGRKLLRKKYNDPSDPEAKGIESEKAVENNYNDAKDWFLNPRSEFNNYWKSMMALCKDKSNEVNEDLFNGKEIARAIDAMIEDTENFPEDVKSFRPASKTTPEGENN